MGKTATIRCISRLLLHSGGRLSFAGRDLKGVSAPKVAQLGVGLVPEDGVGVEGGAPAGDHLGRLVLGVGARRRLGVEGDGPRVPVLQDEPAGGSAGGGAKGSGEVRPLWPLRHTYS